MRTLIAHNPQSGFGSSAVFEFERQLVTGGDECVLRALALDQPAADVLTDAEDFDVVVLSGGDGTVAAGLYALANRDVPTCVFPTGTANLLFNSIGNAQEPAAIAHACREGVTARCDLGEITWTDLGGAEHTRGYSIMAGTGFDAQLMALAASEKGRLGQAAYFTAAAGVRPEVARFVVTCDGEVSEAEAIGCIVANTARIQGDLDIVPNCRMDDGLLDVFALTVPDAPSLLPTLITAALNPAGNRPDLATWQGRGVRVESDVPLPLELDGEPIYGMTRCFEARVMDGASLLVVDANSSYFPS